MRFAPNSLYGLGELGTAVMGEAAGWLKRLEFSAVALVAALRPSTYDSRMLAVTARQIYFSAWQVLFWFTLAAGALSYVVIRITLRTMVQYGLEEYAIELVVRALVLELLPLGVALFVGLRSGAAINTEITLFHIRGVLEELQRSGGDPMRHELVPRLIGSVIAVTCLTLVNVAIALLVLYFLAFGVSPAGLSAFLRETGGVLGPTVVLATSLKILLFGGAVAIIPITAALAIPRDMRLAPVAVLSGMVRLMIALAVIEGVFLAALYV
jgi:phospholipid/cholesterol/gamma-HCH transport system permease protein